ncbi:MAG: DUF1992 domain-containing protein [Chloroflexi bacterium]|nr:DUF1992 domain-containing protein [Chloroflexota bacterium]
MDTTPAGALPIQGERDLPESLAERRIREAVEHGAFRRLAGEGRPLELGQDDLIDREQWLAHKVLKNAGVLPPWIELAKEIDALRDQLAALQSEQQRWVELVVAELRRIPARERERRRAGVEAIQRRYLGRAAGIAEAMRVRTARFNLIVPQAFLQKAPVRVERCLEPLTSAYRPLMEETGWPVVAVPPAFPLPDAAPGVAQPLFPPVESGVEAPAAPAAAAERRARLVEASKRLRRRRPEKGTPPLEWLAALNPLSHAADLLRRRRLQALLGEDEDDTL